MVKLNSIITKSGDNGKTGLADGTRRLKSDGRIEAYGSVDETNSALGLARSLLANEKTGEQLVALLGSVQNDLFNLGADLASPDFSKPALRIEEGDIDRIEKEANKLNKGLPPLDSFILPTGTPAVAALHLARTIARRAERQIVRLSEVEEINTCALRYMNRLSDLLFIMARALSVGREEKWQPKS